MGRDLRAQCPCDHGVDQTLGENLAFSQPVALAEFLLHEIFSLAEGVAH